MANPVDIGLRIVQALDGIGIKAGSFLGKASNVKKAMFGGKSTMFKPNAIQSIRGEGGDFGTALKLIEEEAQYIVNATDAEKMAFLNNLNDYKDLGGPLKKDIVASKEFEQGIGSLKDDIESLQTTAKTMKDDAEKGLKSAEDDLKTFLETGGNPLKKKEEKYLGGSMHEEGQLRTAIRTFLKNEFKNGRIKLDETDKFRVMEYSPMMEDDPIKVFKKIYGDEAYKRAGTFPGAFETGESFNHYESIFRSKMGEDILKVKDKKYVGDGTLTLTKQEEVFEPTKLTEDDVEPFAKGGRASFAGGGGLKKVVQEIIEYITTKFTPMDAMKEVNKVIGKTGKYKNLKLTDDDINDIVEGSNDFIFQRDPDNLYVEGSIKEKTEYLDEDDVLERDLFAPKSNTQVFKDSEGGIKGITMGGDDEFKKAMSEAMEEGMRESENMKRLGLDPTKMEDALKYDEMKAAGQLEKNVTGSADLSPAEDLKREFPGISDENVRLILADNNPQRIAEVKQTMREAMEMEKKGMSVDDIINAFKNSNRTKQADGGITKLRNGYYGGGQAMVEPDLSDIGHGSDALNARTRITSPGSQATTSTGLNYLLGEDNDNTRVPFKGGGLTPEDYLKVKDMLDHYHDYKKGGGTMSKKNFGIAFFRENNAEGGRIGFNEGLSVKPSDSMMVDTTTSSPDFYNTDKFEEDSMTYLKGMYGTGKDSNKFLYNEMIKKGNELRKQGVDRETVIKIIRNNKNKIDEILRQQEFKDIRPKSLAGLANGGRIGFRGGGMDASTTSFSKSFDKQHGTNTVSKANKTVDAIQSGGPDDKSNFEQNVNHREAMRNYQKPPESQLKNVANTAQEFNYLRNLYKMDPIGLGISYGIKKFGPSIMQKLKNLRSEADIEEDGIMQMANNDFTKFNFEDLTGMKPVNNSDYVKTAGLNQPQVDYLNKVGNKVIKVSPEGGSLFTYDSPKAIKKEIESLNPKSTNIFGTFKPDKIVEGDKNTYATDQDVENYMKSNFPNLTTDGTIIGLADGGIAGLRQGYVGGGGVNLARRGFLKVLAGTGAAVAAFKTGALKLLGKTTTKAAPKLFTAAEGSGAPAWFEGMVNKVLADGVDITKKAATMDGQTVKSLDTPTGKVDVTIDRTGNIDVNYMGDNTALGEGVDMRYVVGQADEMTKVKPFDEFEAVESIPEGKAYGPDDYEIEMGENVTDNVGNLFSDTTELAELGGQKTLTKDIVETVKRKKVLKQMNDDASQFVTDVQGDFVQFDDIDPNIPD